MNANTIIPANAPMMATVLTLSPNLNVACQRIPVVAWKVVYLSGRGDHPIVMEPLLAGMSQFGEWILIELPDGSYMRAGKKPFPDLRTAMEAYWLDWNESVLGREKAVWAVERCPMTPECL